MSKSTTGSARHLFNACRAMIGDPMAKLVLIALADRANDDGECWPSIQTLAEQCECHRRTVERALAKLEDVGAIYRVNRYQEGRKQSNVYRITLDAAESRIETAQSRRGSGTESHKAPNEAPISLSRGKRFKPPTLSELIHYMDEAGLTFDPEAFIDYWESVGWKRGKTPMKDWKATARNWARNERNGNNRQQQTTQPGNQRGLSAGERVRAKAAQRAAEREREINPFVVGNG